MTMRVEFRTEGGFAYFPGLNADRIIDTESLPERQRKRLVRLIRRAHFFDLPEAVGVPQRCKHDCHRFTITVVEKDREHTVRTAEPVEDPRLSTLVQYLQHVGLEDDEDDED